MYKNAALTVDCVDYVNSIDGADISVVKWTGYSFAMLL